MNDGEWRGLTPEIVARTPCFCKIFQAAGKYFRDFFFRQNFTGLFFLGKIRDFFQRGIDRGVRILNLFIGSFAFPVAL
jgi:hypothetical protein